MYVTHGMYVMYVCVCMYACVYVSMCVCMYACNACVYVCMYARMHACMHACMYVCMIGWTQSNSHKEVLVGSCYTVGGCSGAKIYGFLRKSSGFETTWGGCSWHGAIRHATSFQSVAVSHESVFNQLVGHMNQCSISWPVTSISVQSVGCDSWDYLNQCLISSPC